MKISKRLQAIADIISDKSTVIDVGCDHALLDIYLAIYKDCQCIATDINENALEQAKYNIKRFGIKNIQNVLTDGLNGIDVKPNDIVVISGMGATTIEHILANKPVSNKVIISAHNDWDHLRKTVTSLGYKISSEQFIIDKGKGYIIIEFVKGKSTYSDQELLYGPYLINNQNYLNSLYQGIKEIYDEIPEDNIEKANKKKRLDEIQSLLSKLN